jgi:hypothetical protein
MTHTDARTSSQAASAGLIARMSVGLPRRAAAALVGAATIVGSLLGPSAVPASAATGPTTIIASLGDGTWLGTFPSRRLSRAARA